MSQRRRRSWAAILALVALVVLVSLALPALGAATSSYELSLAAPFNRPQFYPLAQNLAPPPDYRPTGAWVGRLLLPSAEEFATVQTLSPITTDWAWLELLHAPAEVELAVGQRVRVEWTDAPELQDYVAAVSTPVLLSAAAQQGRELGNVIPTRLAGRDRVGPLQSLAGARPQDDVIVQLDDVIFAGRDGETAVLQIGREPLLIPERYVGLVKIRRPTEPDIWANPAEHFRVQHYNPASGHFDGREEVVRIPQEPLDRNGRYLSTPHRLDRSPAGSAGWYIYGARDRQGQFVVRALIPRLALQLQPTERRTGFAASHRYLQRDSWQALAERQGTVATALLQPTANTPEPTWQEGDRALLLHLFGGIGGERGEPVLLGTVTGHFSLGQGELVRDPFTGDLQWQLEYWQVYGHNPNGIIAGRTAWSDYLGHLRHGWLGSRPVSDLLVLFAPLNQDYQLGRTTLSPLGAILYQLQVMTARYRTGDGTGFAAVTPATSCVQDSNQALYIAITQLGRQLETAPPLQAWLRTNHRSPELERFQELTALGQAVLDLLEPRGQVRPDWQANAEYLTGVAGRTGFTTDRRLANALLSWRSLFPRRAHDELASLLLQRGAALWVIRTNQVGGQDPTLLPVAPTVLVGQYPWASRLVNRLALGLRPVTGRTVGITAAALAIFGAIALPLGVGQGLLAWKPLAASPWLWGRRLVRLFGLPALVEELVFRVWLLPPPGAPLAWWSWSLWGLLSIALFTAYHPLQAYTVGRHQRDTLLNPAFLGLTALLGLACTATYGLTGSGWAAIVLHWLVAAAWVLLLGGDHSSSALGDRA